ncbi:MAG: exodeoxyribonuclease VII small subunit [Bacteroidetes bacterium]|nr:MAG: exodeoxyribonuclease VII small subunit [Bacteroidota bacterium]
MAKKKTSYRDAVLEIEQIMQKLENEELDIDELSVNVKRASELIKNCKEKLHSTEKEIDHILGEMEE